ncbi:MAG: cereblon family protein [Bradymonadaceae bacterium]
MTPRCPTDRRSGDARLRRSADSGDAGGERDPDESVDDREEDRSALYCANCGEEVTSRRRSTAVQGGFEHSCVNPAGILYRIGCFDRAPGCVPSGPRSSEFSWFEGYTWRVGHCRSCGVHLGWKFESDTDAFFGLILDRLSDE